MPKKLLHGVIHDFEPDWNTYVERPGYRIPSDLTFVQVKVREYVAVLLIGGRAPEFLRHDPKVIRLIQAFQRQGKWIFSICHGVQILVAAGLVRGRTLTCYCNVRLEVEQAGGKWVDEQSVVDGRLIPSQTWESHPDHGPISFYRKRRIIIGLGVRCWSIMDPSALLNKDRWRSLNCDPFHS